MRLVWVVISLMLFGIIGITESDAQCVQGSQEPCMDEIFVLQYNTIPHESFDLQITKEVFFKSENIHVRLLNIEDSRCPSDVQCVWEGRATVDINVSSGTPVTFEPRKDLGNYSISLNEPLDGSLIQLDQYSLQLLKVEPYPTSIESIPEWDYVATMKFSKIEVLSPLKQVNNGVSLESITCKDKLELVFKSSNNSPACVKPETAEKLMERGWAIS